MEGEELLLKGGGGSGGGVAAAAPEMELLLLAPAMALLPREPLASAGKGLFFCGKGSG